jgi:O-antigen/teichoic acid export membrane protein
MLVGETLESAYFRGGVPREYLAVSMLLAPVMILQKYVRHLVRATYRIRAYAIVIFVFSAAVRLLLVVVILYLFGLGLAGVIWVPVITAAAVIGALICVIRKDIVRGLKDRHFFLRPRQLGGLLSFGLQNHLGGTIQRGHDQVPVLIMTSVLEPTTIGYYSLGWKVINALAGAFSSVGVVLSPKVARSSMEQIRVFFPRLLRLMLVGGLALGGLTMLALPFLILGLYGREFAPVIAIGWTFIPGVIALYCALSVMVVFSQTGRPIVKSYIRALGLLVGLALFVPLLPAAGALGGAIAVSAGYVAMLLISVILVSRHLNVPLIDLVLPNAEDLSQVREAIQTGIDTVTAFIRK